MGSGPILVVEDNADTRYAVIQLLTIRGYATVGASSGDEALRYLRDGEPPCLVILDLKLPDISGRDVRLAIGRDPRLRRIPVIVLSALEADDGDRDVFAYLRKSADPERLLDAVESACGKRP